MIEFDVDMSYLLDCDELDKVVLNDECGEHEPMEFVPASATVGREPWVSPTWERWHKSLRHDEIKSIGDAVEQLMYEVIEFGGDMGPNGNTYNGIDEGDVLTSGFINEWIARFEATLGPGTCHITVKDNLAETEGLGDVWLECDQCHWQMPLEPSTPKFSFCPNCGARVEES